MRIFMALALGIILIPALGLAGVGQAQAQSVSPVPLWGVVLGTVLAAGLLYLMVHGPDGGYYRYPYYGQYYQSYYRPQYRPYTGFYSASAPTITVAPGITGIVLGFVVINGLQYVLSRDASGRLYRYPYYGPYRQVYYRSTYRQYDGDYVKNGAYRNAPVRQGDPRWDTDKRNLAPAYQRPQQQRQPNPSPKGGRGNSRGARNPRQQCGHSGEPSCPKNSQ